MNPYYLYTCGYLCLCGFWCLGYGGTVAIGTFGGFVAITLVLWSQVVVPLLIARSQEYRNDKACANQSIDTGSGVAREGT